MPPALLEREADRVAAGAYATVGGLEVTLQRRGRDVRALRGVDLEIAPGEVVAVVGESGSGKTILGLSLLGLLPAGAKPRTTGAVTVGGVDMLGGGAAAQRDLRRRHLGAVFQDPMTSLDPTMRIGAQLREATGADAVSLELLRAVGVPDPERRLKAYPHELSGGLRQRVMIAMAVAGEPRLVVADEPTTALDVTVQAQVIALLRRLCAEVGTAMLFVTHDLDVAAQLAERIVVLYGGRVMEDGPTQQILRAPRHPYTAALLRSRLDLAAERRRPLVTLSGEPPDPEQVGPGCPFAPRCAFAQDACRAGEPPAATPVTGGRVACLRLDDIDPLASGAQALPAFAAGAAAGEVAPTVLRARDLRVGIRGRGVRRRERTAILRGVDLEVARGEAIALVGESGCGKTTLLRAAAGILAADGGELSRDGAVQMVFQDAGASLTPWLTIGEQVEDRLRERVADGAERRARVSEALTMVGLPEAVGRARPRELSGGQRQRVAIARAIVVPPALLLCDEPTSALDVSVAAVVLNMLGRLRRELDMALLFVTHDLAVARLVADRIAVMYLGRIVEQGPADDVVREPGHPYTRALLASITDPEMAAELSAGEPPSIFAPPSGCAFHTRCPVALESCALQAPPWLAVGGDERRHVACVHGGELP